MSNSYWHQCKPKQPLTIFVTLAGGELGTGDGSMPIRYCPWCGADLSIFDIRLAAQEDARLLRLRHNPSPNHIEILPYVREMAGGEAHEG